MAQMNPKVRTVARLAATTAMLSLLAGCDGRVGRAFGELFAPIDARVGEVTIEDGGAQAPTYVSQGTYTPGSIDYGVAAGNPTYSGSRIEDLQQFETVYGAPTTIDGSGSVTTVSYEIPNYNDGALVAQPIEAPAYGVNTGISGYGQTLGGTYETAASPSLEYADPLGSTVKVTETYSMSTIGGSAPAGYSDAMMYDTASSYEAGASYSVTETVSGYAETTTAYSDTVGTYTEVMSQTGTMTEQAELVGGYAETVGGYSTQIGGYAETLGGVSTLGTETVATEMAYGDTMAAPSLSVDSGLGTASMSYQETGLATEIAPASSVTTDYAPAPAIESYAPSMSMPQSGTSFETYPTLGPSSGVLEQTLPDANVAEIWTPAAAETSGAIEIMPTSEYLDEAPQPGAMITGGGSYVVSEMPVPQPRPAVSEEAAFVTTAAYQPMAAERIETAPIAPVVETVEYAALEITPLPAQRLAPVSSPAPRTRPRQIAIVTQVAAAARLPQPRPDYGTEIVTARTVSASIEAPVEPIETTVLAEPVTSPEPVLPPIPAKAVVMETVELPELQIQDMPVVVDTTPEIPKVMLEESAPVTEPIETAMLSEPVSAMPAPTTEKDGTAISAEQLSGTSWRLVELGGRAVSANAELHFDGASGFAGGRAPCNSYGGEYMNADGAFDMQDVFSTELSCEDIVIEKQYITALQEATGFAVDKGFGGLVLNDRDGTPLARFEAF